MPVLAHRPQFLTALVCAALLGLGVSPSAHASGVAAQVVRWSDGDTVVTDRGTIRLIGVDTPESGRCGAAAAQRFAARLAPPGSTIRLVDPGSVRDRDAHGRMLRYVERGGTDVAAAQIRKGAWARYDSRDGYQHHPRQAQYRRLDKKHRNHCGQRHPGASKPGSSGNGTSSGGQSGGAVPPRGRDCPSHARIKGNRDSMIYHRPGQRYYDATVPEQCFRTGSDAERAGYRPAKV